jgi:hypothetical protein
MANIKKGLKRIERILLGFGVGATAAFLILEDLSATDQKIWIFLLFLPYLGFKVISWIVMRFVGDDKIKK